MTTPLSPAAQRLLARLNAPKPDHAAFKGVVEPVDLATLPREEFGALWDGMQLALANAANQPAHDLAEFLLREAHLLKHWPLLDDAQVMALLERGEPGGWGNALQAIGWRTDRSYPLPATMQSHLQRLLGDAPLLATRFKGVTGASLSHYAVIALCIAHHMAPQARDEAIAMLTPLLTRPLPDANYRPLHIALTLSLSREDLLAQSWTVGTFNEQADPRYAALHEQVLRDACARVQAIHQGDVPYVPYKAFAEDDIAMVTQAYRYFAAGGRKEAWLPEVLRPLLALLCHAPDKISKGMPSQTLGCKLAEEISLLPTPESISALQAAAKQTINSTVLKVLGQRVQQARTALALRPEIVLALVASGEPDKKQQTQLAKLLQASYWTGLDFSFAAWRAQLALASGAAEFVQQLIWYAQPEAGRDEGAVAFMAEAGGEADGADAAASSGTAGAASKTLRLTNHLGAPVQLTDTARVRLWHPLHSPRDVRQAWQMQLAQRQLRQPLRQAFREHYEIQPEDLQPPPFEDNPLWHANENWHYADYMLALKPMIGVARGEGWKLDKERGLLRPLGPLTLAFAVGAELYSGVDGDAESLALSFWRTVGERQVRVPLSAVPPVLYSEACRAVDLLVSVSAYAFTGNDPRGPITVAQAGLHMMSMAAPPAQAPAPPVHPVVKRARRVQYLGSLNIADMTAMRAQVLAQAFAAQVESGRLKIEGHIATAGEYTVNLSTAKTSRGGEQVEVKVAKAGKGKSLAALPWLPYDEALLEKLAGTLAALI
ncbi:MAG: DUF4132 domain-containing protein [Bdellovibrionales bacterium]|nr:DUF4132 domain-containing protein [Ramlibacter sp.]